MKKLIIFSTILLLFSKILFAQNFLSPEWKISFRDTSAGLPDKFIIDNWNNVNLLLSWERQGYSGHSGMHCLAKKFMIPENYKDTNFSLTLSLQCNVESIYINGKYVGGKLESQFWSANRGAQTVYRIPENVLAKGEENLITIYASGFSYTGGKSYNLCLLTPSKADNYSNLKISVPAKDHLFAVGDKSASINLEYKARQKGSIELFIISDFHDTVVRKTFTVNAGEGTIPFNFTKQIVQPGFYECTAIMKDIGFTGAVRWFTISPEKVQCTNQTVPGFRKYWEDALNELKQVAPEFKIKKVDSLCTGYRDGYIAEMKSIGGITIRGYYFVPRTKGKHTAILHVPGYGYGFDKGKPFMKSNDDVIELAICVRGHGISADVFNPGFGIPGIWGYKLCSEKENAYRSIYMDCVRAVEFLLSRPEVNTNKICVMGGSQGGGLTLATAGLCKDKIKACAFFDPFICDTRDQLRIRTMCNTEIKSYLKYYNDECSFNDALNVQDLIDTKGFADWIRCPVFFTTALFDDDCPPHMGFAVYNRIKSPKHFKIYPDDSHLGESDNYTEMRKFLLSQ
jgi:cephalosporin-C deacetylase-like acetyl esterase